MSRTSRARRITALTMAFSALALITSVTVPKLDGSSKDAVYAASDLVTEFGMPALATRLDAKGKDAMYF